MQGDIEKLAKEAELNNVYKIMVETQIELEDRLPVECALGFAPCCNGIEYPSHLRFVIRVYNTALERSHLYAILGEWRREPFWEAYLDNITEQIKADFTCEDHDRRIIDGKPEVKNG